MTGFAPSFEGDVLVPVADAATCVTDAEPAHSISTFDLGGGDRTEKAGPQALRCECLA
jgi:hypothetical protein